mgnify:FL=1
MTRRSKREVERAVDRLDVDDETMRPPQIIYRTDVEGEYETKDGEPVEVDPDRFTILLHGGYDPSEIPEQEAGDDARDRDE